MAPLCAYGLLGLSTAAIWLAPGWAARGVAISVVAVLMTAIRNAWDVVTWISAKGPGVTTNP